MKRTNTFFAGLARLAMTAVIWWATQNVLAADEHWVGTWSCAPQLTEPANLPPKPGLTTNTLRQVVHSSIGGKHLRARFSNEYGTNALMMQSVHAALCADINATGAIQPATDKALTFHGAPAVSIPPGQTVESDPFDFDLPPLANLTITIRFGATPSDVTGHPGSRTTSYLETGDAVTATNLPSAAKTAHWYFITGVDVLAGNSSRAIVALGDSITDGRGSTTDGNNRWPDNLARRLQAGKNTANVAVLNAGIGGNAVLKGGLGPTALSRFDRDALAQSGVRWLILFEGVNDIGGSTNVSVATNLISAFSKMIDQAHAQNLRVYGATITPLGGSFYDKPGHEDARAIVNNWIRTGGKFDAVIDFDAVVRDPANPAHLLPADDSGDHLHLSVAGYQALAGAIDLKLFEATVAPPTSLKITTH